MKLFTELGIRVSHLGGDCLVVFIGIINLDGGWISTIVLGLPLMITIRVGLGHVRYTLQYLAPCKE